MSKNNGIASQVAALEILSQPVVAAFREAQNSEDKTLDNGFKVCELSEYDPEMPMATQDQYHMYSAIGFNASNTKHHHKYGDVTLFYSETSPVSGNGINMTGRRYIIIADQWTGKRLKVVLPDA